MCKMALQVRSSSGLWLNEPAVVREAERLQMPLKLTRGECRKICKLRTC